MHRRLKETQPGNGLVEPVASAILGQLPSRIHARRRALQISAKYVPYRCSQGNSVEDSVQGMVGS